MRKLLFTGLSSTLTTALTGILSKRFDIYTAPDRHTAQAYLAMLRPDALIIDISLPDGTGIDLLQQIDDKPPVILLLTRFVSGTLIRSAELAGVGYIIQLPCTAEVVVDRLEELFLQEIS